MELVIGFGIILLIIVLANVAEKRSAWRPIYMLSLIGFCLLWAGFGMLVLVLPSLSVPVSLSQRPPPSVGLAFLISALVGGLLLLPPVRRLLARWLPIQADSPVHTTALFLSLFLSAWSSINLLWVGGVEGLQQTADSVPISLLAVQAAGLIIFAFFGVGFLIRRSWSETVERLGLARFQSRYLLIAPTAVVVLLIVEVIISTIWLLLAPEQAEALGQISDQLFGQYDSFVTIFVLALLSSVSEEFLFRGALQPKLGLLLTAVLFAFVHQQYAISPATLIVLLIGIVLGLLRRHFGTWTAVLTHFGYNFTLLIFGLIANRFLNLQG
jgi:membrane protease YdiL (CAAX protease family)